VLNPANFQGTKSARIEAMHLFVRAAYCEDESNAAIGPFTTRCFAAVMAKGFLPDLVRGIPFRVVRRRLVDTFKLNGGEISVRRLMGGAIRIRIVRPLRDLEAEAHARNHHSGNRPAPRRRKRGGNQETPRKADDAGAAP
jgi:hypothetical protein